MHSLLKNTILNLFKQGHSRNLKTLLEKIHPADLAIILPGLDAENKKALFEHYVTDKQAAKIISKLRDKETISDVLGGLKRHRISEIFKHIDPDDTVFLLSMLPIQESESLLKLMKRDDVEDVNKLLKFNQNTSGGIMNTTFLSVAADATLDSCIKEIKKSKEKNDFHYIYVLDATGAIKGQIKLKDIFKWPVETNVSEIMEDNPVHLSWNAPHSEIITAAYRYGSSEIPIINRNKKLVGVISVEHIFKTDRKETAAKILTARGLLDIKEPLKATFFNSIKIKLPLLFYVAIIGFLSSLMLNYYLDIKGPHNTIISFIPLAIITSYILSNSSAAILLRELFFERINATDTSSFKSVATEVKSGLFYGIMIATATILYTLSLRTTDIKSAVICAIGLLLSSVVASCLGAFLSVLIVRAGIKPTKVPLPFIICATTIASLITYLWTTNYLYYTNVVPELWKILKF